MNVLLRDSRLRLKAEIRMGYKLCQRCQQTMAALVVSSRWNEVVRSWTSS